MTRAPPPTIPDPAVPLPPAFVATLVAVAGLMRPAQDDWWVIAGAAAALHGAADPPATDVDVLVSVADAERLRPVLDIAPDRPAHARFRSAIFGHWHAAPLPVEVMAGFMLRTGDRWRPVRFATRAPIAVAGATIWVPSRAELIALLRRFGRAKDRARATALAGG